MKPEADWVEGAAPNTILFLSEFVVRLPHQKDLSFFKSQHDMAPPPFYFLSESVRKPMIRETPLAKIKT